MGSCTLQIRSSCPVKFPEFQIGQADTCHVTRSIADFGLTLNWVQTT